MFNFKNKLKARFFALGIVFLSGSLVFAALRGAGFDGTGPNGRGPLSGRGMGNCEGRAGGQGFGRGRCCDRFNLVDRAQELKEYKKSLEEQLELVTKELAK